MAASVVDRETGEVTETDEEASLGRERVDVARVDPRFIQVRQGRPFITYHGLLDLLHRQSKSCFSIDTLMVQLPTEENGRTAVCTARVRVFDAKNLDVVTLETSGIGDADPGNVSAQMRGHLLRMAETRAKARALRDAVNVGMAALEELGPDPRTTPSTSPHRAPMPVPSGAPAPPVERIEVEGRTSDAPQIELRWRQRREQAAALGVTLPPEVLALVPAETPLRELVGATQTLRRLCQQVQATQAGQREAG